MSMTDEEIAAGLQGTIIKSEGKLSLVRKLSEVMAAVGYLQKTGRNDAQKYNYATEADVVEMMRGELAKRQVFIFPSLVSCSRTRVERPNFKPELPNRVSYATDLVMRWTFVDGESGERMECDIPGCSESPGDKGVYVAMTGSEKYLLMKSFLIPTGDDPEDVSNEPVGTKADAQAIADTKLAAFKERERQQLEKEKLAQDSLPVPPDQNNAPKAPAEAKKGHSQATSPLTRMAPIEDIKEKKGAKSNYWLVKWNGVVYTAFDSQIAAYCAAAMAAGHEADLVTAERDNPKRPGQPYRNLVGIRRIHNQLFDENGTTPIRDVNQDLMDADVYPEPGIDVEL